MYIIISKERNLFNLVFIGIGTLHISINLYKEVNFCTGRFDGEDSPGCYFSFPAKRFHFKLIVWPHTRIIYRCHKFSCLRDLLMRFREEKIFSVFPVSSFLSHTRPRLTTLTFEQSYQLHLFWQTLRKVQHSRRCIFLSGRTGCEGGIFILIRAT